MRNFLLSLAVLFSAPIAFSQQQEGLFIDKDPDLYSQWVKYAVETVDNNYIVFETYKTPEVPNQTKGKLLKITADCELLATLFFDDFMDFFYKRTCCILI